MSQTTKLSRVICTVLSIIMFLSILGAVTVLDLRLLTSRSGIRQILNETLSSVSPMGLTLAAGDQPAAESSSDSLLADWLYGYLQKAFEGASPYTKEQVYVFVQESTLKDFIAEKFSGAVDDFYADQGTRITPEEIRQLIDENAALLQQQTGLSFDDSLKEQIVASIVSNGMLEELAEKGLHGILLDRLESPSGEDGAQSAVTKDSAAQLLDGIRKFTSYAAVVVAIAVYLACAAGYFFLCGRAIPRTLTGCGVPLLIVGAIYAPATLLFLAVPGLLGDSVIATVAALFFRVTAPVNLTVFGLGLAMVVASVLLRKKTA